MDLRKTITDHVGSMDEDVCRVEKGTAVYKHPESRKGYTIN